MSRLPTKPDKILDAAADLIERTGWTRGTVARNLNKERVAVNSPDAACFCLMGSVMRVARPKSNITMLFAPEQRSYDFLRKAIGDDFGIPTWNDEICRSKRQAVAKLRAAARLAREEAHVKQTR